MPLDLPDLSQATATDIEKLWQVVLLDDDHHTYDYVIEMLMDIFGHPKDLAFRMACEVDSKKRVIVDVDCKRPAKVKCQRIRSYGPDWRMKESQGSMSAVVEPLA